MDARAALLEWYRPRRSAYPWRARRDPYAVLVSEVMLQQTQVSRVAPAFTAFVQRFPTVEALAGAGRAEVLRSWAGLGYNRRAVALHAAARMIVRDHAGRVPADVHDLLSLPGVGPYTAAAVASIGHGVRAAAVDTNVRRVVARARLGAEPGEVSAAGIHEAAEAWLDRGDPGGWNQALMDLGRDVCRPVPRCAACPLAGRCRSQSRVAAAAPSRSRGRRRQSPFAGSSREARGAVVRAVVARRSITFGDVLRRTGYPAERVRDAVARLCAEGLIQAGPAARAGRAGGRIQLHTG
jgi:A/G-specific adenine glycosylase